MTTEEEERLTGYSDPAVVRHFDAPEAMGVKFYEVRAKSALNRVPKQSQVPFRWTINPYRGCAHACVFCAAGETPILTADGRTKPISDLRPGDRIYGTQRRGRYRRYVPTDVVDHWQTLKPAWRTTLEDGTELVTSGDHRFLTNRGWKHVTGAMAGADQRPYLTANNELPGTGAFASAPDHDDEYRRGYLCGLIRGDGSIGSYSYQRPGRAVDNHHRFRLALTDLEALRRAREYLDQAAVRTDEPVYLASGLGYKPAMAIRTQARDRVQRIRELVEWPARAGDDWCKGFLAGIFDAEGSYSRGILRMCDTDPAIIDWTTWSLRRLGFPHIVEDRHLDNGMKVVRLTGGLRTHLRFFHTTDPAITRKRTIDGYAFKSPTRLRIEAIEPLGIEMPMYDITTGTGDFISNGVVSHNCFARPTHQFLDMNAREDFDRKIVVKVNLPELVRKELARPSWTHEHVALGTNTDPYQWVEKRYRITRGVWEAMRDFKNPCSVLTKSPLLLRDLDLFQEIAAVAPFTANLSIPTIDEKVWRQTEPHTPNPRARIEAVAELNAAGIPCGVLVAPLMPGVNDQPDQVEKIVEMCADAGASHIGGICLHLRGEVRDIWFEWLEAYRPDLIPRYEQMYARGAYAPKQERERIQTLVRDARPESVPSEPPDFNAPPFRLGARRRENGARPPGRLMRGGMRGPEPAQGEDAGAPIQQSLF
ncbi:MAG: radical SAM protein [Thermoleophilaceae bacterium]